MFRPQGLYEVRVDKEVAENISKARTVYHNCRLRAILAAMTGSIDLWQEISSTNPYNYVSQCHQAYFASLLLFYQVL
jgi:hypothetical protein